MNDVDVLLASYQGERFIKQQVLSILHQTHQKCHLWIRDDHSTDNTLSILQDLKRQYPERLTLIPSQTKLGVRGNFSQLMKYGTAKYILFSDQDDYWLPTKIESSLKKMQEMEKTYGEITPLLVHTDLKVVDSELKEISPSFWKYVNIDPKMTSLNRLLTQFVVTGCTMMLNRPLLNLSFPIPQECYMHDWWIALVASSFGQIDDLKDQTILYRQHDKNDVGAKQYGLKRSIELFFSRQQNNHHRTIRQSQLFLERYDSQLTPNQRQLIMTYSTLKTLPFLKRKLAMIKHRFFKTGFLRNLHSLFE